MKKLRLLPGVAILAAGIGFGGISLAADAPMAEAVTIAATQEAGSYVKGKVWGSHVIELPVITEINYEKGLADDDRLFGQYGCSAIVKTLDNGDTIVGRSMDLYYSNRPAYVLRTAVPGFYKTVGLAYNSFGGPTFAEVTEKGVSEGDISELLFFTTDVMNEKGFYIEANMRPGEPKETGILPSSGTNPGAEYRLSFAALPRFLGERCATVEEAAALAETLDVHGMRTKDFDWCGAVLMVDAFGHRGLLELVDNKLVWLDGQNAQANFYVNDEYKDKAIFGSGYGRYELLQKGIDDVLTEKDMMNLIAKVKYSQIRTPYTCLFDPITEFTGPDPAFVEWGGVLTVPEARNPENKERLLAVIDETYRFEKEPSLQELRDDGTQWYSVFQVVANCNRENLHVMFFEDPNLVFDFAVEK